MDIANLSSNWKKLQATLHSDRKQELGVTTNGVANRLTPKHAPPPARQLKRKAPGPTTLEPGADNKGKRQKTSGPQRTIATQTRTMGAIVSSLGAMSSKDTSSSGQQVDNHAEPQSQDEVTPTTVPTTIDSTTQAGKYVSLDCEMVGTHSLTPFSTPAHNQRDPTKPEYSILARVSLVTYSLQPLYDAYVLPPPSVTISDYRTPYSGITSWHLTPSNSATTPKPFHLVQREVAALLKDRVLVGHALKNDLAVLGLSHPRRDIRDTARHPGYRALAATIGKDGKMGKGRTPSLKKLSSEVLGWDIQGDEKKGHSSVEDAKAAMALFRKEKAAFDKEVMRMYGRNAAMGRTGTGNMVKAGKGVSAAKAVGADASDTDEDDDGSNVFAEEDVERLGEDSEGGTTISGQKPKRKAKRKKRTKRL